MMLGKEADKKPSIDHGFPGRFNPITDTNYSQKEVPMKIQALKGFAVAARFVS
jgi:hypothetical protein